jgi:hypothetical protein
MIERQMQEKRRQDEVASRKQELIEREQGEHVKLLKEISAGLTHIDKLTELIDLETVEANQKLEQVQAEQKKTKEHFLDHPKDRLKVIMEEWANEPVHT